MLGFVARFGVVGDFVVGVSGCGEALAGVAVHLGGGFFRGEVLELAFVVLFAEDGARFYGEVVGGKMGGVGADRPG